MGLKIYKVNPAGMEQIKHFLLENHKNLEAVTTETALSAWASDAELFADINDDAVIIDIPEQDCVHGHAVTLTLDESFLDIETISELC